MRAFWLAGIATASLIAAAPAFADTLRGALLQAYNSNPTILGARARQRQVDEGVPIAKADGRPSIAVNSEYTENVRQNAASFLSPERQATASINAQVPLYLGGAVRNAIQAAKIRVESGRANLRSTEADVFTDVVAAYMDVIRDQAIVDLNANQVSVLETNLRASKDRFEVGDLTRTDVAQSEARLSLAHGQLDGARAQLVASREFYLRIVGKMPESLEAPPSLPGFPETADVATEAALDQNPQLIAIRKESEAARYDVGSARSARLPRISAVAGGTRIDYLNSLGPLATIPDHGNSASVGVQATLPLYQGGGPGARVRQAQARESETLEQTIAVERGVIAQTRSAYASYVASQAVIRSSESAVSANELALEGVRAENSVGTRDVLDVLNAEQELLNSRVQLVSARRNAYVAGFALLAAMGRAEAASLGLDGGVMYDPTVNYRRVRTSIFDWGDDGPQDVKATSTVNVAPLPSESLQPLATAIPDGTSHVTTPEN